MTSALEQSIRDGYVAMTKGDFDTALIGIASDVEWIDPPEFPDRFEIRGAEALKEVWRGRLEPFDDFGFEVLEFLETPERAFVSLRLSGRGAGSQAPAEMRWFQVTTLDATGVVVRLENFLDRESAERAFRE